VRVVDVVAKFVSFVAIAGLLAKGGAFGGTVFGAVLFASLMTVVDVATHVVKFYVNGGKPSELPGLTRYQELRARRAVRRGEAVTDPVLAPAILRLTRPAGGVNTAGQILFGVLCAVAGILGTLFLLAGEVVIGLAWFGLLAWTLSLPLRRQRIGAAKAKARVGAEALLATGAA
jgi:hypothetical protein